MRRATAGNGLRLLALLGVALAGMVAWHGVGGRSGRVAQPARAPEDGASAADATLVGAGGAAVQVAEDDEARRPAEAGFEELADASEELRSDPYAFQLVAIVTDGDDLPAAATLFAAPLGCALNRIGETDREGRRGFGWRARQGSIELAVCALGKNEAWSGLRRIRVHAGVNEVALRLGGSARESSSAGRFTINGNLVVRASIVSADGSLEDIALMPVGSELSMAPSLLAAAPDFIVDGDGSGAFAKGRFGTCPRVQPYFIGQFDTDYTQLTADIVSANGALRERLALKLVWSEVEEPAPTASFTGIVLDEDGSPAEGALVALGTEYDRVEHSTRTDAGGLFRFDGLPERVFFVRAGGGDHGVARTSFAAAAGHEEQWRARLDRGNEIVGRLKGAFASLEGFVVEARADDVPFVDRTRTGADGAFRIPNVPAAPFELLVRPPGSDCGPPLAVVGGVWPSGAELVIELAQESDAPARAVLRVVGENDPPAADAEVRLWSLGTGTGTWLAQSDGSFVNDALLEGAYEVEVLAPRRAPLRFGPVHLRAGRETDLGTVALEPAKHVELRGDAVDAAVLARARFRLWDAGGAARALVLGLDGNFPPDVALPAGKYELELGYDADHEDVQRLAEEDALPAPRVLAFDVKLDESLVIDLQAHPLGLRAAASVEKDRAPQAAPAAAGDGEVEEAEVIITEQAVGMLRAYLQPAQSCSTCH